jgi:branched-subunit amino acid transport protein
MSRQWVVILMVSLVSAVIKASGPLISGRRVLSKRALDVVALLPAALLTAFVLVDTVSTGQHLVIDARLGGLAAAAVALLCRAPVLVVVLVAAVATAALRAFA